MRKEKRRLKIEVKEGKAESRRDKEKEEERKDKEEAATRRDE